MTDPDRWRSRAMRGMEKYFRQKSFPRLMLGIVLILTGLAGFGFSFVLLRMGMEAMWLRYPLAVLGAYGIFLLLMRLWVELERQSFDPNDPELLAALEAGHLPDENSERRPKKGSWLDWLDLPTDLVPDGEGCLVGVVVLVLLGVIVGLVALVLAILSAAPALIAEVFVDAVLVGALYRRLKMAEKENWLGTCIRKTWVFVVITMFVLAAVGAILTAGAPGAKSMGSALEQIFPREE